MHIKKHSPILLFLFVLLFPSQASAGAVRISVAASMTDVVRELAKNFSQQHPDITILPNFGSSGSLAKQIIQGAPAHIYISANRHWMDYLIEKNQILPATVSVFACNELVFVGNRKTQVHTTKDVATLSRIAIGSPGSVPAGYYAVQAMKAAKIYHSMRTRHKLVMAKDVRQALLYAERGEVDGAFIYRSDALIAQNARILFTIPKTSSDPIVYPLGMTVAGITNKEAQIFYDWLQTPDPLNLLKKYGFTTAEECRQ